MTLESRLQDEDQNSKRVPEDQGCGCSLIGTGWTQTRVGVLVGSDTLTEPYGHEGRVNRSVTPNEPQSDRHGHRTCTLTPGNFLSRPSQGWYSLFLFFVLLLDLPSSPTSRCDHLSPRGGTRRAPTDTDRVSSRTGRTVRTDE